MDKLLTIPAVSKILGVSIDTTRELVKSGKIKSIMIGKRHKVRPSDLEAYLQRQTFEPVFVYTPKKRGRPFRIA